MREKLAFERIMKTTFICTSPLCHSPGALCEIERFIYGRQLEQGVEAFSTVSEHIQNTCAVA